jgi:DMSO/TMAO reductase YedYZ molybdopterin-dependent catalytic subunit
VKLFGPKYPEELAKRIPPGQRLVKGWPVLHYGPIPRFDEATWDFQVTGLVENPYTLTYAELKALEPVTVTADMHCVTGWTTLDNEWEGVPFRVLAERATPKPEASWVITHCDYGYTSNLSLAAMLDDDVLVAWAHSGQPLEPQHGFPLRLVVPKRYAWKSAKWLRGLEFTDQYSYQEALESATEP